MKAERKMSVFGLLPEIRIASRKIFPWFYACEICALAAGVALGA
jgi:hypothetical protein